MLAHFLLARIAEDEAVAQSRRDDAECEAKRRIVEQAVGIAEVSRMTGVEDPGGERILRLLALPYADHHDYRDEWKPNA